MSIQERPPGFSVHEISWQEYGSGLICPPQGSDLDPVSASQVDYFQQVNWALIRLNRWHLVMMAHCKGIFDYQTPWAYWQLHAPSGGGLELHLEAGVKNLHIRNCAEIKESPLVSNNKLEFNLRFPSKNTTIGSVKKKCEFSQDDWNYIMFSCTY